jgi:hypothetical protein
MKMRVQGNVIRYRLNRPEVAEFARSGKVSSSVVFPGNRRLTYSLIRGGTETTARFEDGEIRLEVPAVVASEWTSTDVVGITEKAIIGSGDHLEIVIEKDFQCMHKGEAAKDPDAYPNPLAV